jgi:hypothetical protein
MKRRRTAMPCMLISLGYTSANINAIIKQGEKHLRRFPLLKIFLWLSPMIQMSFEREN